MPIGAKEVVFGVLAIRLAAKTDQFVRQMGRGKKGVDGLTKSIVKSRAKWQAAGAAMTAAGGLIIGTLGLIVNKAARFEQAITNAASVTGKTGVEFDIARAKMAELAKELGERTVFSATQAAGAFYDLSSKGFDVAAMSVEELVPILNLAAATQYDLSETTKLATATLRGFGLENSEMARVADVLTKAIGSSAANMENFSTSMPVASTAAKVTGVAIEEVAAALGLLYNRGIEASTAGTGLRNVMMELAAPGTKVADLMERLEISTGMVDLKTVGLSGAMAVFEEKGATAVDMLGAFGKRNGTVAAALIESHVQLKEFNVQLENAAGTAESVAGKQLGTLLGQLQMLKSATEAIVIPMGESLLPILTDMSKAILPIVRGIASWVKEHPKLTATLMIGAGVLGGLLVAFGLMASVVAVAAVAAAGLGIGIGALVATFIGAIAVIAEFTLAAVTIGLGLDILAQKRKTHAADEQSLLDKERLRTKEAELMQKEHVGSMGELYDKQSDRLTNAYNARLEAVKNATAEERDTEVAALDEAAKQLTGHLGRMRSMLENAGALTTEDAKAFATELANIEYWRAEAHKESVEEVNETEQAFREINQKGIEVALSEADQARMDAITDQAFKMREGSREIVEIEGATQEALSRILETASTKQANDIETFLSGIEQLYRDNGKDVKALTSTLEEDIAAIQEKIRTEKTTAIKEFLDGKENMTERNLKDLRELEDSFGELEKTRIEERTDWRSKQIQIGATEREALVKESWDRRGDLHLGMIDELVNGTTSGNAAMVENEGAAAKTIREINEEKWNKTKELMKEKRIKTLEQTAYLLVQITKWSEKVGDELSKAVVIVADKSEEIWKGFNDKQDLWLETASQNVERWVRIIIKKLDRISAKKEEVFADIGGGGDGDPESPDSGGPGGTNVGRTSSGRDVNINVNGMPADQGAALAESVAREVVYGGAA